ncbi:tetratricopeptide repeat protein [Hellea balneolensis]|uniref:tetratricopeptide repeat protein n=1 Tax=Hellea balneolensis TaxID=287478 RepID=UPI0003F8CE12|nr:tetratricopeptide repeat protein [Hellea balneolensis]
MKKTLALVPASVALVFASSASANNMVSNPSGTTYNHTLPHNNGSSFTTVNSTIDHIFTGINNPKLIGDGSSTASRYYRIGVKAYEKNDLKEAERAFNGALVANGLNAESLIYLAKIAEANGEMEKAVSYALRYHKLTQRK